MKMWWRCGQEQPTFLQHRVDHLSVSHQLQVPQQDLLQGADLLLGGLGHLCGGDSRSEVSRGQQRSAEVKPSGSSDLLLVPPLACLVLLLWRAGGQVVLQAPPQLLATAAATEAVVGVGVGRHTHYTSHGLTCSEVPNHRQQVKAPPGVSSCV